MDGPEIKKWMVQRVKTERPKRLKGDGSKGSKWKLQKVKSGWSRNQKMDSLEESRLDGPKKPTAGQKDRSGRF